MCSLLLNVYSWALALRSSAMCMNGFGSNPVPVVKLTLVPLKTRVMQEPVVPTILCRLNQT